MRLSTSTERIDHRVGNLASRQHGVVSRAQLQAFGLSRSAIETRIRHGWLRPLHRGVYAVGHTAVDQHGTWLAAVLAAGGPLDRTAAATGSGTATTGRPPNPDGATVSRKPTVGNGTMNPNRTVASRVHQVALSHWSAAALHGIQARDRGTPEVTTTGARPQRPELRVHRSLSLDHSVTVRDGIPCTTVARTLIDIAGSGNARATERSWSSAASRGLLRLADLDRELRAAANRPGSALIRDLCTQDLGYLQQPTRSGLERETLRLCRDFDIPRPDANVLIRLGDECYEADLAWPASRLIVEADGDETHGHVVARRTDRARDARLQLAGWRTIRVGRPEVTQRRRETAELLRAALMQPPLVAAVGDPPATC